MRYILVRPKIRNVKGCETHSFVDENSTHDLFQISLISTDGSTTVKAHSARTCLSMSIVHLGHCKLCIRGTIMLRNRPDVAVQTLEILCHDADRHSEPYLLKIGELAPWFIWKLR